MGNPVVTEQFLETKHKGEISYKGQGGTPFNPPPMKIHDRTDRMLHVFASDYVLNSLFYHATVNKHLTVELNESTIPSDLAEFLQITCSDNACLGDILPELKDKFPNHIAEVRLEAGDMPYIIFDESKMRAEMKNGKMEIYPKNRDTKEREFALGANIDMQAEGTDIAVDPKDQRIHGKVDMKNFDVRVERSEVGEIPPDKLKELSKLGETLLADTANDRLDDGIPLPKMKAFELTNTDMYFKTRTLTVDTDVKADMDELKKEVDNEIQEAIEKNNEKNQG